MLVIGGRVVVLIEVVLGAGNVVVLSCLGGAAAVDLIVLEATANISFTSLNVVDDIPVVIFGALIVTVSGVKRVGKRVVKNDGKKGGGVTGGLGGGEFEAMGVFVRRGTTVLLGGLVVRPVVVVVGTDVEVVAAGSVLAGGTVVSATVLGGAVESSANLTSTGTVTREVGLGVVPVVEDAGVDNCLTVVGSSVISLESGTGLASEPDVVSCRIAKR